MKDVISETLMRQVSVSSFCDVLLRTSNLCKTQRDREKDRVGGQRKRQILRKEEETGRQR